MAERRGFGGRSCNDLHAEAEAVSEMLAQLRSTGSRRRGTRRDTSRNNNSRRVRSTGSPPQERDEGPWYPRGRWTGQPGRFRPGPSEPPEHYYPLKSANPNWHRGDPDERPHSRLQNQDLFLGAPLHRPQDSLTPHHLVHILEQSKNFTVSLLDLLEKHNLPSHQVRMIVGTHGHLFLLQNEAVVLSPRLALCASHASPEGCQGRDTCDALHICPKFVFNWCSEKACLLGHRWHTDHNLAILKRLFMNHVRFPVLRQLLRSSQVSKRQDQRGSEMGPLGVCKDYNEASCDQVHCNSLHVCLSFVLGLTICSRRNCCLNHDLLSPTCCHLLRLHRLPVNETPRDVAMILLQANPTIKGMTLAGSSASYSPAKSEAQDQVKEDRRDRVGLDSSKQQAVKKNQPSMMGDSDENSSSGTDSKGDSKSSHSAHSRGKKSHHRKGLDVAKKGKSSRTCDQGNISGETSEDSDNDPTFESNQGDKLSKKPLNTKAQPQPNTSASPMAAVKPNQPAAPPKPCTMWAHDLYGDVVTPQICYYSVESTCRNEETGCTRLHSINHFHWQVCTSDQNGRWFNLRPEQTACIERAFCNPNVSGIDMIRLDPTKLDSSVRALFLLLGRELWHADFTSKWKLTNSSQTKSLQLRRLCTQPVAGQIIKASTHHWYFQDINKKWVKYGEVDTANQKDCVSSLTSADIEKHYVQNPGVPLTFNNSKFTYILDLITMKQTNQSTQVSRKVRRRPESHLPEDEADAKAKSSVTSDLPHYWDAMQPEECSRVVSLAPTSDEYKHVVSLLSTAMSSLVVKVERIQNPFKWRALQNRVKELTALYKDQAKVDVRHLFHGTAHNVVARIFAENFDCHLHGTANGQSYGQGAYFGIDAHLSYQYCRQDSSGLKYMFVARVAVGSMIVGKATMQRPPINPTTSMPYESTVDNLSKPKLVVKYSEQEYYPEYLLTLT